MSKETIAMTEFSPDIKIFCLEHGFVSPDIKIFCLEHGFVSSGKAEKIEKENTIDVNYLADCGCIVEYEYNK